MVQIIREIFNFFRAQKKLWLIPLILAMVLIGFLLILASNSIVAPFIYTIF